MNCDRIARYYRWLEYLSFGRELERRRFRYLADVADARSALILGGGDGRFLARFARTSRARIHYIDSSARMLALARERASSARIRYQLADARQAGLAPAQYDLIVAHFFLDCFEERDAARLIERVAAAAQPRTRWLISEFRPAPWSAPATRALYLFFRAATGLKTRRLIDHRPWLIRNGFRLEREERSYFGWLASELWART
ncbi:MAG TPA: class I SAM-dependent methyltransferase [Bryobacteraceae bacterium]